MRRDCPACGARLIRAGCVWGDVTRNVYICCNAVDYHTWTSDELRPAPEPQYAQQTLELEDAES